VPIAKYYITNTIPERVTEKIPQLLESSGKRFLIARETVSPEI